MVVRSYSQPLLMPSLQSNAMQVTISLEVDNGVMMLPAGFPGYEKYSVEHAHDSPEDLGPCLVLSFPAVQVHLRTNDYYMGMQPFQLAQDCG